ncbi:RNA polymerase sigma factor [Paludisphaera borealis]|uniref:RNA polymerase sigma-70 region 2 domain-containing protein n=1 Tax=Paludisphaera borealis TaxID=1387353 RepID=A0A1U7CII8_9BACT|nr:hypothetical protein BSF38_00119 [Paludisphaera borealis]
MAVEGSGAVPRSIHALLTAGTFGGLTDGQLIERFVTREGEAAELAFAALMDQHGPMVLRVCRGVLPNEHDAEDAFQAMFLILARKARSIRPGFSILRPGRRSGPRRRRAAKGPENRKLV